MIKLIKQKTPKAWNFVYFFISWRTHQILLLCDAMISRMESQRNFVETWDGSTKIELVTFSSNSSIERYVRSKIAFQKHDFEEI